jgi:hypothetical protein
MTFSVAGVGKAQNVPYPQCEYFLETASHVTDVPDAWHRPFTRFASAQTRPCDGTLCET